MDAMQTARTLGWLSLGVGLIEFVSNRTISRTLGLGNMGAFMRACAVREVASGIGLLAADRPSGWLWARVAGDAMDMLLLAPAVRPGNPQRHWAAAALAFVASVTAVDLLCARRMAAEEAEAPVTIH